MRQGRERGGGEAPWPLWFRALLVACVVLLAACLRGYRLAEQSVWLDEYASIGYVGAPDLLSYLHDQREMNDETVPLYFVLEYYWARWVGSSALCVRWMSILFGLLAIPLLYRLGRQLYGEWAGLIAALLLALSPFHLFHDQEIRVYSLMTLLGLASAYAFLRLLRSGAWPWWLLNLIANVLLVYTHLLAFWLLAAEGVFLLLFRLGQVRRIAVWAGAHALLLMPLALIVMRWDFDPETGVLPGLAAIGSNLYGVDVERARWAAGHLNSLDAGGSLPGPAAALLRHFGMLRTALIGVILAGLILLLPGVWAKRSRRGELEPFAFLVAWHVLPVVMLYAFARGWSAEAFQFRYTMYSSLALYLLLGGAVATLRWAPLRPVLAGALLTLYGLHAYLGVHLPQRTDYLSAGRLLHALAGPEDTVIFHPNDLKTTFEFNLGPHSFPIQSSVDMSELLELTEAAWDRGKNVVVVLVDAGHFIGITETPQARSELFERYLALSGISYSGNCILGENDIFLYACPWRTAYQSLSSPAGLAAFGAAIEASPRDILFQFLYARALGKSGHSAEAIAAYQRALDLVPRDPAARRRLAQAHQRTPGQISAVLDRYIFEGTSALLEELLRQGRLDEAIDAWRGAVDLLPNDGLEPFVVERLALQRSVALGETLVRAGRSTDAVALYRRALAFFPDHKLLRLALAAGAAASGRAEEAALMLREAQALEGDTATTKCQEGDVLLALGKAGEALDAYRQAAALDPEAFEPYVRLDALHMARGGPEARLEECRQLASRHPASGRAQFHLGMALAASGNTAGAAEAYRRAVALRPEDPAFASHLGETLMALGDVEGAVAALRQALLLNPDIARLRPLLVQALIEIGDREGARAALAACRQRGIAVPPELVERVEAAL